MKSGLGDVMKQAQQMQQQMQKVQDEINNIEVTGVAGGDLVQITMSGGRDVNKVRIDPSLLADDRDMLEDLLAAAINDANRRIENAKEEKISTVAKSMGLPAGMKLPF